MADSLVVSIEVDGRQAYILETDRLREMLGASRLIQRTVKEAERLFDAPLYLLQPVSGEIRVWAANAHSAELMAAVWRLREWLTQHGLEHTVAVCSAESRHLVEWRSGADESAPSLAGVQREIGTAVSALKARKPGSDARPVCSLFAPCQIHALDFADEWRTGEERDQQDDRRNLRGFRARAKYEEWESGKPRFFKEELERHADDLRRRIAGSRGSLDRPVTIDHLSEAALGGDGDQFVAVIRADGDGMGQLLTKVNWNHSSLQQWAPTPWQVNSRFASEFDRVVHDAYGQAVRAILARHHDALIAEADGPKPVVTLPLLPQLLGGDDLWTVCRRVYALEFCGEFGRAFSRLVQTDGIVKAVIESTGTDVRTITMSLGVAFAKSGHPIHASLHAAEQMLRSAKARRKSLPAGAPEGCVDWCWIDSSLAHDVLDAREVGWRYREGSQSFELTTRPWTLRESELFVSASAVFSDASSGVPRRKREQLEDVLRRGVLSGLAWEAWRKSLRVNELKRVDDVVSSLDVPQLAGWSARHPWSADGRTAWLDLLSLDDVLGHGTSTAEPAEGVGRSDD